MTPVSLVIKCLHKAGINDSHLQKAYLAYHESVPVIVLKRDDIMPNEKPRLLRWSRSCRLLLLQFSNVRLRVY